MKILFFAVSIISALLTSNSAFAVLSEAKIKQFANQMTMSANAKNVQQIANLIDDKALISLSRKGQTGTLDKSAYLNLLQNNWSKSTNYRYHIEINNILITGSQAKADITTTETLTEQGKTITIITNSRATFHDSPTGVVLGRAISQLTIH